MGKWYLVEFMSGEVCEWGVAKWTGTVWEDVSGDIVDFFHGRYILITKMEKALKGQFDNE